MHEDRIRILHVVDTLSIGSGIMSFIMNYYRNIDRTKVQFDFLYMIESDNNFKNEILSLGGKVHYIKLPSFKKIYKYINEVNEFFDNNSSLDVVHLHQLNIGFIIFPIAQKYGIKKLIMHAHATKYSDKPINSLRNLLLVILGKKHANIYFACSKAAGTFIFGKKTFEKGNVKIINNAVDYNLFKYNSDIRRRLRKELGISDEFIVGHVGRFEEPKNHFFLLQIFKNVIEIRPNSKLILIGEGSLYENFKLQVEELELLNNVIFMGLRNDVGNILQAMDVFVLPSFFEGFGTVLIEAQIAGLPCIASENVSIETKITGSIEYISLKESAKFWAQKAISLSDNTSRGENETYDNKYSIESESRNLEVIYLDNVRKN